MGSAYTLNELAAILGAGPPGAQASFSGVSTDTRKVAQGELFVALKGEQFDGNEFVGEAFARGASAALVSDGAAASHGPCILVPDTLAALQAFAGHHRQRFDIPIVAVTGSCGKTTSKDFIASVLSTRYRVMKTQGNLNNEIGCPLSLLRLDSHVDAAVIEMGANHAGEIRALCALARPTEAAITMIAPSHLEGFGSIEGVAAAKAEIVEGLSDGGTFYVNANDTRCVDIAGRFSGPKVTYGTRDAATGAVLDVALLSCEFVDGAMELNVDPIGLLRLPLYAKAHAVNVLLAVAVGLRHGVTSFEDPLRDACVQSSRFNVIEVAGMDVIDDSYNANPASMRAALEALAGWNGGRRIAALGEMLELGEGAERYHREIGAFAGEIGVSSLFVRGTYAEAMAEAARDAGVPDARAIDDHAAIASAILDCAESGDVLLVKGSRGMRMERVIDAMRTAARGENVERKAGTP